MDTIETITKEGVKYFTAYFSCPVCLERGNQRTPATWNHSLCNKPLYLGSNAMLLCQHCNDMTFHVAEAQYSCPGHSNRESEYVGIGDVMVFAEAMSTALALTRKAGIAWVQEFLSNLQTR